MHSESPGKSVEEGCKDRLERNSDDIQDLYNELYIMRTTPEQKNEIVEASKNEHHHAAYACMALMCDDVGRLEKKRLSSAIDHLEGLIKEDPVRFKGMQRIIYSLDIMLNYILYSHSEISMERLTRVISKYARDEHSRPLVVLPKANITGLDLQGSDVNLSYSDFHHSLLSDSKFIGCNLEYANLADCTIAGSDFEKCKLNHANLGGCGVGSASFGRPFSAEMREVILFPDNIKLTTKLLDEYMNSCLKAGISTRLVMENLFRSLRFLNHHYTHDEKQQLLTAFSKHPMYRDKNNMKREEVKYCARMLTVQFEHIAKNKDAIENKKNFGV